MIASCFGVLYAKSRTAMPVRVGGVCDTEQTLRDIFRSICFTGLLLFFLAICVAAQGQQVVPFEMAARDAALKSTLAQPGGASFHLRAVISDQTNHDPQWDAEVEEWWISPTRFKRTFHCSRFAQSLVVDGAKVEEKNAGPVFPELLRNLTIELTDTIPRLDELEALHLSVASPDGMPGQIVTRYTIPTTDGAGVSGSMDASVAIDRETGLMVYGGNLDWDVALHDFAPFHTLQVARQLTAKTEGGPRLTAQVTLLEDLSAADSGMIHVTAPTPMAQQLRFVVIPETELRKLTLHAPLPCWPKTAEGVRSGTMTMRVVVDRSGQVQSVDNFFSKNPDLQVAAEKQLLSWRFRPYVDHGVPVQIISTLTFAYDLSQNGCYRT
jgi:hypothetical protein